MGKVCLALAYFRFKVILLFPALGLPYSVMGCIDARAGGSFALYAQLRRQGLPDPDAAADKDPNASGRSSHLTGTTPPRVMVTSYF